MKVIATVAAATLIFTGLTLPTVSAFADESTAATAEVASPQAGAAAQDGSTDAAVAPDAAVLAASAATPEPETEPPAAPLAQPDSEATTGADPPAEEPAQTDARIAPLAAGNAVLTVTAEPVDYLTGDPITEAAFGQNGNRVAYRVAYSCSVEDCENVQVQFSPSQPDPYGLAALNPPAFGGKSLLTYETWTRPNGVPDIAPTGDDQTGKAFSLGTLAAGASGTFLVTYQIQETGTYTTARPAQFYPDGFQIQMGATMTSDTATGPAATDAAPVTWRNKIPEPSVTVRPPAAAVQPDTNVTVSSYMGTGAFPRRDSGSITGTSEWVAAGNFTVTQHLPAEAEVVGTISDGGVYDAATHSITWTRGTEAAPEFYAAGGWGSGSVSGWSARGLYNLHNVSLRFPAANFPEADVNGCNFERTLPVRLETSVTYLDQARTTKTATTSSDITVSCYDPFGVATASKDVAPNNGSDSGSRIVYVPNAGSAANAYVWDVYARNGGNVPGVAVIEDDTLDLANAPVHRIELTAAGTIEWVLSDGQSGTTTAAAMNAPAGTSFASVKVTTPEIAPGRVRPTDTGLTNFRVRFLFTVASDAPVGEVRSNTATSTMSWPSEPTLPPVTTPATSSLKFTATPGTLPRVTAGFPVAPAVEGGGTAVPGRNVVFSMNGTTQFVPTSSTFTPEYVFIAPTGWTIVPDSAGFAGTVPDGVTFEYATRTVGGVDRQVVVATWPVGTDFGDVATLPIMTVTAKPTSSVAAGTTSVAEGWIGDSARNWTNTQATYAGAKQNTGNVDGSGDTTAWFSSATQNAVVSSADSITVTKEICRPDADAADGCDWVSDPAQTVPVPLSASSITYRISLQNTGNTMLGDVVAYDVLPYIGDTGLTTGTAGTPRGSTFEELLTDVTSVSSNLSLSYSASTNPARPEVNPTSGGVNDWGAGAAGKRAIRAQVNGSLAPGQVASFTYEAAVGAGSATDAKACNSVAISTDRTLPAEPQPVCATTAEADVEASGVNTIDAQLGRPTVFPFVFENLGGSQSAPATVKLEIPAGVTVTDLAPSGWTCMAGGTAVPVTGPATLDCTPPANLEKDAPVAFDLPVIVTANGVAVTATITGTMFDPDEDNNEHTITVPDAVPATTDVEVAKTDGIDAVVVGQEATYTITVTNPLAFEALSDVAVTDALPAGVEFVSASDGGTLADGSVTWTIDEILAGASKDVTVTVRVLDAAANTIVNTASVSVVDPALPDETLTGTGSDTDAVDRLTLTKTGALAGAGATPGDVVTYTFVATNGGGGVISGVTLADPKPGLSPITITSWPSLPGYLGAGQSVTGTATYTLTQADLDAGAVSNTATVAGSSAGGSQVTATATEDIVLAGAPAITLTKTAALAAGTPNTGDPVTYTFVVENTGNVTLTGVTVTDGLAGLSAITFDTWPGAPGVLAAGQQVYATASYVLTQEDVDRGSIQNTATAAGNPPAGDPVSSTDDVTVLLPGNPALTLDKRGVQANPAGTVAGDTITYTLTAVNSGNVTLTGVTIADPLTGVSPLTYTWPGDAGVLAPGEQVTGTATYVTTQVDVDAGHVDNTATVTGTGPGGATASAIDSVSVPIPADPQLTLTKQGTVDAGPLGAGDQVDYTFVVENTGSLTITDVAVTDPLDGLTAITYGAWPGTTGTLAPGQSVTATATYTLTQADIDRGRVDNTATAAGTAPGDDPVSTIDSATVNLPAVPAITLVKDASIGSGTPAAGDEITYTFEVENVGNVTLNGVDVADALPGLSNVSFSGWPAAAGTLTPGATVTATATYTLAQADLDAGTVVNTATASGTGVRGGDATAEDSATVDLPAAPALSLVKTAGSDLDGPPVAGDTVDFTFEVRNIGNVTVTGVSVLDTMPGLSAISYSGWSAAEGVLAPGELVTGTASYTLTQDDLDAGAVFNDATVTGTPVRGSLQDAEDSVTVDLPAAPALAFTKTGLLADLEFPLAGQLATFTFEIENTGNVTVTGLAITDELKGLTAIEYGTWPGAEGSLSPGQTVTATASYPLTQTDIDEGELFNAATVIGSPARGDALEEPAETTVELPAIPGLIIVKRADLVDTNGDGFANPGEKITYSFDVTNTGNVTLHDTVVNDPKVAGIPVIGDIAPDETVTVSAAEYTVTTAEANEGHVVNTATATGSTPVGATVDAAESTTTTKAALIPGAPTVTSGLAHTGFTGTNIGILSGLMVLAGATLLMFVLIRRRREEAATE